MDREDFISYLRGQYRPPQEVGDNGGFIVPHYIMGDKPGFLAFIARKVGLFFCSKRIYHLGTRQVDLYAQLSKKLINDSKIRKLF